jgi:hypothetical protein
VPIHGTEVSVQILGVLCLLLYVATATAIGSRLFWAGVRGGRQRRPELLLGAGTLLVATIALPMSVFSGFGGRAGDVHVPLWAVSEYLTQIGIVCLYAFTQQVFRPRILWSRAIIAIAAVVLPIALARAVSGLANAPPDTISVRATGGWLLFCQFGYMGSFLWSAIEGLVHHSTAQRRVAIGLVDPAVANRFLLFAIYGTGCSVIAVANVVAIVLGLNIATSPVVTVPAAIFSVISSVAMFLAIFPPAWFLARLRAGRPAVVAAR